MKCLLFTKIIQYVNLSKSKQNQFILQNQQTLSSKEIFKKIGSSFLNIESQLADDKAQKISLNKIIIEQTEQSDAQIPSETQIKGRKQSLAALESLKEQEEQEEDDDFSDWRWIKDSRIVFMIYTKLCNNYLSDQFLNERYKIIEKEPILPLFSVRIVINDEKNLKKKISQIYKSFKFKRIDQQKMADILWRCREQLYSYKDLTYEDMFFEIAVRNDQEYSIENFQKEIGESTITKGRLGWFNVNQFLVTYEPPLEVFEDRFKDQFANAIKNIKNFNKIFGEFRNQFNSYEINFI